MKFKSTHCPKSSETEKIPENENPDPFSAVFNPSSCGPENAEENSKGSKKLEDPRKSEITRMSHDALDAFFESKNKSLSEKGLQTLAVNKKVRMGQLSALRSFFRNHPDTTVEDFSDAVTFFLQDDFFSDKLKRPKQVCDWFSDHIQSSQKAQEYLSILNATMHEASMDDFKDETKYPEAMEIIQHLIDNPDPISKRNSQNNKVYNKCIDYIDSGKSDLGMFVRLVREDKKDLWRRVLEVE